MKTSRLVSEENIQNFLCKLLQTLKLIYHPHLAIYNEAPSKVLELVSFVTFSSVPAEFLSFVYISVRLIRQFAQFVTSFYPLEAFCSVNTSFAVSLLMSNQLLRVGIQTN